MPEQELRLAELLAALSVTTDLAMGQPPEKAIRSCVLATELARALDLPEAEVADVYWTSLLKHLGCTATLLEENDLFGPDDPGVRSVAERTDVARPRDLLALLLVTGQGAGFGRLRYLARSLVGGKEAATEIVRGVCEVAAHLAERLGMGEGVRRSLHENAERWDGKGDPNGLRGDAIALPARIAELATQAVIFHRLGGIEAAGTIVERRSGGWFDPAVVAAFRTIGSATLERLDREDPWVVVLDVEPHPVRRIAADRIGPIAEAFADMVDLKSTYTLSHSSEVAALASAAGDRLRLPDPGQLRLAALLHDLGRTGVATGTWEKPGPLASAEWEQVRLHPYQTERILTRAAALAPLARIAGMHHERQDGSGYHHGASAAEIPVEARVLAAADAYQAMTQDRPHRRALTPQAAAETLAEEARAGGYDQECVRAVLDAAGARTPLPKTAWPAGLSDRELEVIRLVARGASNQAVADALVISRRTAEHHVQHIYAKIGVSTRAAAAMFAMEHGLLR